jgi:hypothetical protein
MSGKVYKAKINISLLFFFRNRFMKRNSGHPSLPVTSFQSIARAIGKFKKKYANV